MDAAENRRVSVFFLYNIYKAIILAKEAGISFDSMEEGFRHALLHVQLLNLDKVPPLPADLVSADNIVWEPPMNHPKPPVGGDFHG